LSYLAVLHDLIDSDWSLTHTHTHSTHSGTPCCTYLSYLSYPTYATAKKKKHTSSPRHRDKPPTQAACSYPQVSFRHAAIRSLDHTSTVELKYLLSGSGSGPVTAGIGSHIHDGVRSQPALSPALDEWWWMDQHLVSRTLGCVVALYSPRGMMAGTC